MEPRRPSLGSPDLEEEIEVDGRRLRFLISPEAFFQTNTEMAEKLYGLAVQAAGLTGAERVYDLYCGIGTIGLSLAARAGEVWGIESVEPAIADAIRNAELNGIDNARFYAGDVRTAMRPLIEEAGKAGRGGGGPAAGGPFAEDRQAGDRDRGEAHRLRVVQSDDAGAERAPARGGGLPPDSRHPGGHVPPDTTHRVSRAAGEELRADPRSRPADAQV